MGLKKTCLGVLDRGEREKDDETGLKEGGVIEMSTTVLPYTRCTLSSLKLLTNIFSAHFCLDIFFPLIQTA